MRRVMKYWKEDFEFSEKQREYIASILKSYFLGAIFFAILIPIVDYYLGFLSLNTILRVAVSLLLLLSSFAFDFFAKSISQPSFFQKICIYTFDAMWLPAFSVYLLYLPNKNIEDIIFIVFIIFIVNIISNFSGWGGLGSYYKKQKLRHSQS